METLRDSLSHRLRLILVSRIDRSVGEIFIHDLIFIHPRYAAGFLCMLYPVLWRPPCGLTWSLPCSFY